MYVQHWYLSVPKILWFLEECNCNYDTEEWEITSFHLKSQAIQSVMLYGKGEKTLALEMNHEECEMNWVVPNQQ